MACESWQFAPYRGSEGEAQAEIPRPRARIRADVDPAEARVTAHAVHVRIESRIASTGKQVLAREVQLGCLHSPQPARGEPVTQRERLQPQVRTVLHERAVEPARSRTVGSRDVCVSVGRGPAVADAGALVGETARCAAGCVHRCGTRATG